MLIVGSCLGGGKYSLIVERYCGRYDGENCHEESVRVAVASATTIDDTEDDVDALSPSSFSTSSSVWAVPCGGMIVPEASDDADMNISDPRPVWGAPPIVVIIYG
jgi:hypothetical protein